MSPVARMWRHERQPILARHHDVEDDEVDRIGGHPRARALGVAGLASRGNPAWSDIARAVRGSSARRRPAGREPSPLRSCPKPHALTGAEAACRRPRGHRRDGGACRPSRHHVRPCVPAFRRASFRASRPALLPADLAVVVGIHRVEPGFHRRVVFGVRDLAVMVGIGAAQEHHRATHAATAVLAAAGPAVVIAIRSMPGGGGPSGPWGSRTPGG